MSNVTVQTVSVSEPKPFVAADLLKSDHPLHATFVASLNGVEPTKRQARKFLASHPEYRQAKPA